MPLSNAFNNNFLKIFYVIALSNQRLSHFLNARASSKDAFLIGLGILHKQYVVFKLKKITYITNFKSLLKRNQQFLSSFLHLSKMQLFYFQHFAQMLWKQKELLLNQKNQLFINKCYCIHTRTKVNCINMIPNTLVFQSVIQNKNKHKIQVWPWFSIIGVKLNTFAPIFIHILVLCTSIRLYFA